MLNKLKNNNKASSYMEKGVMYVALFLVGTFIIDIILLGATMVTLNHQLNYISVKLQFQGGFIGSVYDTTNHWINKDFFNYLDAGMNKVGIDGSNQSWGLTYYPDVVNYPTNKVELIRSVSSPMYLSTYKTPNREVNPSTIGNLYKTSHLTLWFEHKYKFSGKAFNFLNILSTMNLHSDFKNEYLE